MQNARIAPKVASIVSKGLVAGLAIAMATSASAQAPSTPAPTMLVLTATGEVQGDPDMASIGAGVVTTAADAATALAENSARMTRMLAALTKAGVAARDIQTSNLSVRPQYRYPQNEQPVLSGFEASNRVQVRLRDVKQVGAVVDALVATGSNQIDGPEFTVADPKPLLDKARVQAVRAAQQQAALYAEAAGLKVGRLVSIAEQGAQRPMPPMPRMMAMAAEAAPVVAGEVNYSVSITAEFELTPR